MVINVSNNGLFSLLIINGLRCSGMLPKKFNVKKTPTRMWTNAQRDGRPVNIGGALCLTPQSFAEAHC